MRTHPRFLAKIITVGFIFSSLGSVGWAVPMILGAGPDNNQTVLLRAIASAQHEINVNVYELNSQKIADALASKIRQGVSVQVLVEGQPVSGYQIPSRATQEKLVAIMRQSKNPKNHFFLMTGISGTPRRFRFDHAKYTLIDQQDVLIGSENYSATGHASPGTLGNRGWEVLVRSPQLAQVLLGMYRVDTDLKFGDIVDAVISQVATSEEPRSLELADEFGPLFDIARPFAPFKNHDTPPLATEANIVDVFRSPDTSHMGLIKTIRLAQKSLDLELMSFKELWGTAASPLFTEVIAAARRGVHVRVLLNDDSVFNNGVPNPKGNIRTVKDLLSATRGLPLEARICNVKNMNVTYIHNKGAIVDDSIVMISSINWTQNAVANNRELAILIQGPATGPYYKQLFDFDWQASTP